MRNHFLVAHLLVVWSPAEMARKNPIRASELTLNSKVKALRVALRIPRTHFALMAGITGESLTGYEQGRVPMRPETAAKIQQAARKHLRTALTAYRQNFGEDAIQDSSDLVSKTL